MIIDAKENASAKTTQASEPQDVVAESHDVVSSSNDSNDNNLGPPGGPTQMSVTAAEPLVIDGTAAPSAVPTSTAAAAEATKTTVEMVGAADAAGDTLSGEISKATLVATTAAMDNKPIPSVPATVNPSLSPSSAALDAQRTIATAPAAADIRPFSVRPSMPDTNTPALSEGIQSSVPNASVVTSITSAPMTSAPVAVTQLPATSTTPTTIRPATVPSTAVPLSTSNATTLPTVLTPTIAPTTESDTGAAPTTVPPMPSLASSTMGITRTAAVPSSMPSASTVMHVAANTVAPSLAPSNITKPSESIPGVILGSMPSTSTSVHVPASSAFVSQSVLDADTPAAAAAAAAAAAVAAAAASSGGVVSTMELDETHGPAALADCALKAGITMLGATANGTTNGNVVPSVVPSVPVSSSTVVPASGTMMGGTVVGATTSLVKSADGNSIISVGATDEIPLVEVTEASRLANDAFNRVKAQKIAEQALTANRAEEAAQFEGLGSEIVGKAMKQRERERSNRAAAAASRARVLTYQHELEARLNRIEAERNLYRREVAELRSRLESNAAASPFAWRLAKVQAWFKRLELEDPELLKSIATQGGTEGLLRDEEIATASAAAAVLADEEPASKKRRV